MRRFPTLVAAVLCSMPAGIASATMILQSFDAKYNDRFYVGDDKAFIGDPYDWSGVGRSSYWATMVSDSYFLSATHFHPADGAAVDFYWTNSPTGSFETRTVLSGTQIGASDLWLGKLASPVSANVAKYPILSLPEESSYDNLVLDTFGLSDKSPTQRNMRQGRNNIDPGSFQTHTEISTGRVYLYDYDRSGGQGANESYLQTGDSGGPSFVAFGGQPTLVGIHWYIWDDDTDPLIVGSADTFVPHYIDAINQSMQGEQLTVVPEPATIVLLILAGLALLAKKGVVLLFRS
jgi:hypothetical protein